MKNTQNYTKLSTKQLKAITILSSIVSDKNTIENVSKQVGVCRKTIYNWFENNEFKEKLEKERKKDFLQYGNKVRKAHLEAIFNNPRPSPALIKLYYEFAEGWKSNETKKEENLNTFAEIIAKAQENNEI